MNSSTRLYARLEQIPQDPTDPESLDELIVCAFGAFERYYVCWRNRAGEYRHDGHDLPDSLREWLYPPDGSTRDFATLQVVFGRGDDYFASDKDGKMEYKESEARKTEVSLSPEDTAEKIDKPSLRRSRTVSFIRPLSDPSAKSFTEPSIREGIARPPSLPIIPIPVSSSLTRPRSISISRSTTDPGIMESEGMFDRTSSPTSHPSTSRSTSRATRSSSIASISTTASSPKDSPISSPVLIPLRSQAKPRRPLSMSLSAGLFPKIVEGRTMPDEGYVPPIPPVPPLQKSRYVNAGVQYDTLEPIARRPTYADASVQTDPEPLPPPPIPKCTKTATTQTSPTRPPLSLDTTTKPEYSTRSASSPEYPYQYPTPIDDHPLATPNPIFMGRMLDYFNRPGYKLGDSLQSTYSYFGGYGYEGDGGGEADVYEQEEDEGWRGEEREEGV